MTGGRYKSITNEVKNYFLGQYGKSPAPVNEKIKQQAVGDGEVITCRPADLLSPEMAKLSSEAERFAQSEEDVLTFAMFPDIGKTFLQERNAGSLMNLKLCLIKPLSALQHRALRLANLKLPYMVKHSTLTSRVAAMQGKKNAHSMCR